uniref:Uncharacterized protein n=1 Tax=Vespula pensylvanica TaxID=30213 RepID=A0A834NQ43_VESPE|nr:hypothetical protein H0235_011994 [Vespula pensylvanica]
MKIKEMVLRLVVHGPCGQCVKEIRHGRVKSRRVGVNVGVGGDGGSGGNGTGTAATAAAASAATAFLSLFSFLLSSVLEDEARGVIPEAAGPPEKSQS